MSRVLHAGLPSYAARYGSWILGMIIHIRCLFRSRYRGARLYRRVVVQRAIQSFTKLADVVGVSVKTVSRPIDALPIRRAVGVFHCIACPCGVSTAQVPFRVAKDITCPSTTSPWLTPPSDPRPLSRTVRLTSGQARCERRACSSAPLPAEAPLHHAPDREHGWHGSLAAARQTTRHVYV